MDIDIFREDLDQEPFILNINNSMTVDKVRELLSDKLYNDTNKKN